MPRTRLFLGVAVSNDTRRRVAELQSALAPHAELKWVESQLLHVTLLFLGDVDDREMVAVCKATTAAARREPPFALGVSGLGAFPNARRPKVLWGGITDGADSLLRLFADIAAPLVDAGIYRPEERGYNPHLTLGRANADEESQKLAAELATRTEWDGGRTDVEEVVVYSSEMRRSGPEYAVIARGPLLGGD
jgi:RNA 2',3'-cyclic 3'-phosphodiesterase